MSKLSSVKLSPPEGCAPPRILTRQSRALTWRSFVWGRRHPATAASTRSTLNALQIKSVVQYQNRRKIISCSSCEAQFHPAPHASLCYPPWSEGWGGRQETGTT